MTILEKSNEALEEEMGHVNRLIDELSEKDKQIELMKCCGNCKHYNGRETLNCINYFNGSDVCNNWEPKK